jgi:hypothetical protein
MYLYTFILDDKKKDYILNNNFQNALIEYLQWRGMEILVGKKLAEILITPTEKNIKPYNVDRDLIDAIINTFNSQNPILTEQEIQCKDMQNTCPNGSKDADPILQEDWCDDIPFKEFVKNDQYLTQCYRLSHLLKTFQHQLESTKNSNPFSQWPNDPFTRNAISPERLNELNKQAKDAGIDIPEVFKHFIQSMNSGKFNVQVAMAGPYIGKTDQTNPAYINEFVEPMINNFQKTLKQEDQDLELALQLAKEI